MACKMRRVRGDRGAFPPSARLDVLSMATRKPTTYHCPATHWSLDDLVAALHQRRLWTMSRSSIWRILDEADHTPHCPWETGETRARVHPSWGTGLDRLVRRRHGTSRLESGPDTHQ